MPTALDASFMMPTLDDLAFTPEELEELQPWLEENNYTLDDVPSICTPNLIGPTWQTEKDSFGRPTGWKLPKYSLGWHIAEWVSDYLLADDGSPWVFTLEQLRFILWWYAVDEFGNFIYRTGVLQRLKGWGKDPLLAILCLVEFVGPSRFDHWGDDGQPRGVHAHRPWVQITAVNLEQSKTTMELIPGMMSERLKREYNVRLGEVLIRALNGKAKIQAVTASYRAIEGKRTTFSLLNETHHWVAGNKGHKMFETLDGNATKMNSRYLAITNAFLPGEDSVAERMRTAYEDIAEGTVEKTDVLYDSIEADDRAPLHGPLLRRVIERIRGDAHWLTVDSILSSINDPMLGPARSRRMWLNQVVAAEDALVTPQLWASLYDKQNPPKPLEDGEEITMGFDGSKSGDTSALVALRLKDRAVFVLGLWEPRKNKRSKEDEEYKVPREEVDAAVKEAFARYKVRGFYADVHLWESYIDKWGHEFADRLEVKGRDGSIVGWDMRSEKAATLANERLLSSIFNKMLTHDGDKRLARHVGNTKRDDNEWGVHFRKESRGSRRSIDLWAAMLLAHEAMVTLHQRVKDEKPQKGSRVWFY